VNLDVREGQTLPANIISEKRTEVTTTYSIKSRQLNAHVVIN